MPFPLILLLILAMPLAEIAAFIAVGSQIGVGWTLLLVVGAMLLGVWLVRRQSFSTLQSARAQARSGHVPAREIVHGAMIVLAGLLMILPGFISDVFGLLLLVPPVRDVVWRAIQSRVIVTTMDRQGAYRRPTNTRPEVVELTSEEFRRAQENDPAGPDDPIDSPWAEVEDERPRRD